MEWNYTVDTRRNVFVFSENVFLLQVNEKFKQWDQYPMTEKLTETWAKFSVTWNPNTTIFFLQQYWASYPMAYTIINHKCCLDQKSTDWHKQLQVTLIFVLANMSWTN